MMKFYGRSLLASAAFTLFGFAGHMTGAVISNNLGALPGTSTISGTLNNEADVMLEDFSLSSSTSLTVFTTSYGGGVNLDGTTTAAGGFQSNVSLFDTTGFTVAQTSGSDPMGTPVNGIIGDSYFTASDLAAGSYILAVSNWATTGDPVSGFTDSFGSGSFTDPNGNPRNGNFTVDISASSTPEPASFWLTLPVLASLIVVIQRRGVRVRQSHLNSN